MSGSRSGGTPAAAPPPSPDCEAAHGNNVNGCCPRCGGAVRVVGFQSCECGREQIEQLVAGPTPSGTAPDAKDLMWLKAEADAYADNGTEREKKFGRLVREALNRLGESPA